MIKFVLSDRHYHDHSHYVSIHSIIVSIYPSSAITTTITENIIIMVTIITTTTIIIINTIIILSHLICITYTPTYTHIHVDVLVSNRALQNASLTTCSSLRSTRRLSSTSRRLLPSSLVHLRLMKHWLAYLLFVLIMEIKRYLLTFKFL